MEIFNTLNSIGIQVTNDALKSFIKRIFLEDSRGLKNHINESFLRFVLRDSNVQHVILQKDGRVAALSSWLFLGRPGKGCSLTPNNLEEEMNCTGARMNDKEVFLAMYGKDTSKPKNHKTKPYNRFARMIKLSQHVQSLKNVAEIKLVFKYTGPESDLFTEVYDSSSIVMGAAILDINKKNPEVSAIIVQVINARMIRLMKQFGFERMNSTTRNGMWYALVGDWPKRCKNIMQKIIEKK